MGLALLSSAVASVPLVAQTIVSPKAFVNRRGTLRSGDAWGFWAPTQRGSSRWQAIHGDVPRTSRTIVSLGFRQADVGGSTQRVGIEIRTGHSDLSRRSPVFSANMSDATVVFRRRDILLKPFPKRPPGGYPAPFTVWFPFDRPWRYDGKRDLAYEIQRWGGGDRGFQLDGVDPKVDAETALAIGYGHGCVASGRSLPMTLGATVRTYRDARKHTFQWIAKGGPAYARGTILLATRRTERLIFNLCTLVYVDGIFAGFTAFTDAGGTFGTPVVSIPFDPTVVGAKLFAQAYALDNGRHPALAPVSATPGAEVTVPPPPLPKQPVATISASYFLATKGTVEDGKALIVALK